jgi:8-oxo-dGTP pyrophosphatase MutT (NUDIX family)
MFKQNLLNSIKGLNVDESIDAYQDNMAAVGVLFDLTKCNPELLLIRRSRNLRNHPGEWAFPGGKVDQEDKDYSETALREIREEVGLNSSIINLLGRLETVKTTSGYYVVPYVGILDNEYSLRINVNEVDDYMFLPFNVLISSETYTQINYKNQMKQLAYVVDDRVIWGATARIISNVNYHMRKYIGTKKT